jgi:hypothetical protein
VEPDNNSIRGWVSPFLPIAPVHCKDLALGYQDLLSKTAVAPPIAKPLSVHLHRYGNVPFA